MVALLVSDQNETEETAVTELPSNTIKIGKQGSSSLAWLRFFKY